MKALVYKGVNDLRIEDVPKPRLESSTDAIVRVTLASIGGADVKFWRGKHLEVKPGNIIGHECCGVVEDVGSDIYFFKKGDRVVAQVAYSCGECYYCRHQQPLGCERGGGLSSNTHGTDAEYVRIPFADTTLAKIPDSLTDEDVIFISDVLPTAFTGVLEAEIEIGDTVAVFGSGPVGLCAVACTQLFGPSLVIAVDLEDSRLKVAQKFGAMPINASKEDPVARIRELTSGRGADATIEAAGLEPTLMGCLQAKRMGGRVSILGVFPEPVLFPMDVISKDRFKITMGTGSFRYKNELIELIRIGKLDLKPMITHRLPLSEAIRGYEMFEKKSDGCIKVVLKP